MLARRLEGAPTPEELAKIDTDIPEMHRRYLALAAPFVKSAKWAFDVKADGRRLIIDCGETVRAYNRAGDRCDVPLGLRAQFEPIGNIGATLDGELVGDSFYAFDLPRLGEVISLMTPWNQRRYALEALIKRWKPGNIKTIGAAGTTPAKKKLLSAVRERGLEGVVFKRIDSQYQPGRRASTWLKHKLTIDADFVVTAYALDGKQSFELALYDGDTPINVGQVSALTGDGPKVSIGDVVTVTFLNSGDAENPRLYQPVKPRLRNDKRPEECTMDQLAGTHKVPV